MIKWKFHLSLSFFLSLMLTLTSPQAANATDQELASSLTKELEFDANRRNDFKNHRQGKNTYEQEREKGLSLFLEEQEKWDVTREKGLKEQRASRAKSNEMDESSPEYAQDQKEKKKYEADLEISRQKQIATKQQVIELFKNKINVTEEEELSVYNDRPRYALRMRGKNKWTGKGKSPGGSSGSSSGGYDSGATIPSAPFDYPPVPNQDYVPTDNFDELPPPPPMMPYDGGNQYPPFEGDPGFGAPGTGYPPPPPDGGWDF